MKKNIFIYALLAATVFVGCKKDDGMVEKSVSLERVPYINVTPEAGSATVIVPSTIATFVGKIVVNPLYASDKLPDKVDIVIIKNGVTTNVKTLKAGITTFPTTVTFTGPELATLFGTPTVTCDAFTVGTIVYVGDKSMKYGLKVQVVRLVFAAGTQINQPGYSMTINYNTKVEYDPNIYKGVFVVTEDKWEDFHPGDLITLTQVNATQFSFISPFARDAVPVIVTVDPATLLATIAKQVVGSSWVYDVPSVYPQPTMSSGGATSLVAPCAKTVSLAVQYGVNGVAGGIFGGGPFSLKLVKQ